MTVKQIMLILTVSVQLTGYNLVGRLSCPTRAWREYILHASEIASSMLCKLHYKSAMFVLLACI